MAIIIVFTTTLSFLCNFSIPPQNSSDPLMGVCEELCASLEEVCPGDVVLENRTHLTLGARRRDALVAGYPVTVVVGKKVWKGKFGFLFHVLMQSCFCYNTVFGYRTHLIIIAFFTSDS